MYRDVSYTMSFGNIAILQCKMHENTPGFLGITYYVVHSDFSYTYFSLLSAELREGVWFVWGIFEVKKWVKNYIV